MKTSLFRFVSLLILLVLIMAMLPVPAYAQTPTISGVAPPQIFNNVDNIITITGTDFDSTAQVSLGGTALLRLTQSPTELTALVPVGFPVGSYDVTVATSIGPVSCPAPCVTVSAPAPTATTAPLPFVRPQFVIKSSRTNGSVSTNSEFKLIVVIDNAGTSDAYSTQAVLTSSDLVPLKTGGVVALGTVAAGNKADFTQSFLVTGNTYGVGVLTVDMTVTYYDDAGMTYSDKFALSVPTSGGGSGGVVYPTSTPTGVKSSQLVITDYAASIDPLQPGEQFALTMTVQNMGNEKAQRVTMIVGGGSSGTSGGTPQPGGVSGGSGEFTNFAPVGASNVQSLGDLPAGGAIQAKQNLIVNVSTSPGAYPMKVTFSYLNEKGEVVNDEQVITLLVYSLPNLDVSFYRPPDPFFVGQPGALPIQIVNLGKRLSVLGTLKVTAANGTVDNGSSLIGSLDAGGYFTLDSMLIPDQSGTLTLTFTIDYTDDFNQPRTITRTLDVEVMEAMEEPPIDPSAGGGGGGFPVATEETTLQKIWRFILGLFGLDSSAPSGGGGEVLPPGENPVQVQPIPGKG